MLLLSGEVMALRTISSLNSKMKLLSVGTNAKTIKGDSEEVLTAIMYLAPHTMSGYEVCPNSSEGCRNVCLVTAGRGAMTTVQQARIRKTKLFFEDNDEFITQLINYINLFQTFCLDNNIQGYVRLNGTSDILWESYGIFEQFPDLRFYDYTKIHGRDVSKYSNYKLTFSRSEDHDDQDILSAIELGHNVAIVFDELPESYLGIPVIQGDLSDLRWEDPDSVIVGLKAKGKARKSTKEEDKGFVIRTINI